MHCNDMIAERHIRRPIMTKVLYHFNYYSCPFICSSTTPRFPHRALQRQPVSIPTNSEFLPDLPKLRRDPRYRNVDQRHVCVNCRYLQIRHRPDSGQVGNPVHVWRAGLPESMQRQLVLAEAVNNYLRSYN